MARGPSRSQSIAATVEQAEALVARGFQEVVLTGVNVGDYGRQEGRTLLDLLVALHGVRGLGRLKISSIEPNLLTDDIVDLMAESDRLMPHVHLPLQSGSDRILAKMRRRYRVSDYAQRLQHLLDNVPHCAVGADVIVGFPGERRADFAETVHFLEKLPVTYLHVFTYSERADTPAARMADHLPRAERRRRTRLLRRLSDRKRAHFAQAQRGRRRPVLFERVTARGDLTGLTDHYLRVEVPPLPGTRAEAWLNRVAPVEVGAWQGRGVALGRLVDRASRDDS
jgi:threonylcarbamoyladenosine tRNA methylthiotransferase MtaB